MHWIDFVIFGLYLAGMLGIGFYFMRKNQSADDYFVGGRKMGSFHIGLSVVVSGMFIPVLAGIFLKKRSSRGALWAVIAGGTATLSLILSGLDLPFGLDANIYGIALAVFIYLLFHFSEWNRGKKRVVA